MPWLMDKTMTQVNQLILGRTILDSIIRDVVNQRVDNYEKLAETLRQVKNKLSLSIERLTKINSNSLLKVESIGEHPQEILLMVLMKLSNEQNQVMEN